MTLFTKRNKDARERKIALVFDVGSASVAGALVVFTPGERPRILYAVRKRIVFQENLNFERFVKSMFQSFTTVLDGIQRKGLNYLNKKKISTDAISHVLITYASPWYSAHTKVLTLEKSEPFLVTQDLIEKLIRREEERAAQEHLNDDGNVIERDITSVRLNGYNVSKIEGKRTKELELTVSTTLLARSVAHGLENIIETAFQEKKILHHSFPLAAFTTARDIFEDIESFVFLDVNGEMTDVSLIRRGALLETISFPMGKHFFVRILMKELGVSVSEAESLLRMYGEEFSKRAQDTLASVQSDWSQKLKGTFNEIEGEQSLPSSLFYIADKDFLPFLNKTLESSGMKETFDAEPLGYMVLRNHVDFAGDRMHDSFIGIGTFFLNRVLKL